MDDARDNSTAPSRDTLLMLALCPVLAVSDTVPNAIAIAISLVLVVALSSSILGLLARFIDQDMQWAAGMLVTAIVTAIVELFLSAWFHEIRHSLGVFVPLLVCNVAIVYRFSTTRSTGMRLLRDALALSLAAAAALVILGIARELVGRGSLFHDASHAFGAWASFAETVVFDVDMGFLLAMLPPGAFFAAGLLLALYNAFHSAYLQRKQASR